jgi:hypothetical protein
MPWIKVRELALDYSVRRLCKKPYPGHPKGCPNYAKRADCPPRAKQLTEVLDLSQPLYLVYNRFNLGDHVFQLKGRHPKWSDRQLYCCLYWQGMARKELRLQVSELLSDLIQFSDFGPGDDPVVLYTPEACGVDITATMASVGITLEWPPRTYAYQVALIGHGASRGNRRGSDQSSKATRTPE